MLSHELELLPATDPQAAGQPRLRAVAAGADIVGFAALLPTGGSSEPSRWQQVDFDQGGPNGFSLLLSPLGGKLGQAARAVALGIITEAERRKGRAFVYGLAPAELGLVMASRATDATRFYALASAESTLYDEGSRPEPIDPAASLARAWGRSDAMGMASDELERQQVVKRLAVETSPEDLAARRQFLAALGRGDQDPAVVLELARAQHHSAVAEVTAARRVLAEAILDVEDAREVAGPANPAGQAPPPPGRPVAEVAASQVFEAEARAEAGPDDHPRRGRGLAPRRGGPAAASDRAIISPLTWSSV